MVILFVTLLDVTLPHCMCLPRGKVTKALVGNNPTASGRFIDLGTHLDVLLGASCDWQKSSLLLFDMPTFFLMCEVF